MDVILHVGAHHTDGGALLRSLLKNSDTLMDWGVAVPGPSRYRKTIGSMVTRLRGDTPTPDAQAALMESLLDGDMPDRIVLSSENFICVPDRVLDDGALYARAFKTTWLRQLFPEDEVAFAISLRNPATLLSALWRDIRLGGGTYEAFIGTADPLALRWSRVITQIREANPGSPVIVWCNEDAPFVWPEVMHLVAGVPENDRMEGEDDMLARVMQRAGMILYKEALAKSSSITKEARRSLAMDLLDRYAAEEQLNVEVDVPGWTHDVVNRITDAYDADLEIIRDIPGVILIEP